MKTQSAPGGSVQRLVRRTYRCPNCKHVMRLTDDQVWGKIIRCIECTAVVANNLHGPPSTERRIQKGVTEAFDFWLSQHDVYTVPDCIDAAIAEPCSKRR